jgi:hypothetical protein
VDLGSRGGDLCQTTRCPRGVKCCNNRVTETVKQLGGLDLLVSIEVKYADPAYRYDYGVVVVWRVGVQMTTERSSRESNPT